MQKDVLSKQMPDIGSVIVKKDCFKTEDRLLMGVSNDCNVPDVFHTFIDCDEVPLREIIRCLQTKPYSDMGDWLILSTSPWHFSLANFAKLSWNDYAVLLQDFPLAHEGYVHYTLKKHYAVLRLGAKYGIAPELMYKISNIPEGFSYCKKCYNQMFQLSKYIKQL